MVQVETSTTIERPVHGTTYRLDIKPFMGETQGTGEVVAYDPDRRIELRFTMGKMKPHVFHLFEPAGAGTKFTRRIEMEISGFMRIMAPLMGPMLRKKNVGYLATLKKLIEA